MNPVIEYLTEKEQMGLLTLLHHRSLCRGHFAVSIFGAQVRMWDAVIRPEILRLHPDAQIDSGGPYAGRGRTYYRIEVRVHDDPRD